MAKLSAEKPKDIAHEYFLGFGEIKKSDYLPVSKFEKHKLVKQLLGAEPAVQIAYVRYMADGLRSMRSYEAKATKPIPALTAADRANPVKVDYYNCLVYERNVARCSVPAALALEILLRQDVALTHDDLVFVANRLADMKKLVLSCETHLTGLARHFQSYVDQHGTTLELSKALGRLANAMKLPDPPADHQAVYQQLKKLAAIKPGKAKKTAAAASNPEAEAAQHFAKILKIREIDRMKVLGHSRKEVLRHKYVLAALQADPAVQAAIVRLTMDRIGDVRKEYEPFIPELSVEDPDYKSKYKAHYKCLLLEETKTFPWAAAHFVEKVFSKKLPFTADDVVFMLKRLADLEIVWMQAHTYVGGLLKQLQKHVDECGVTPELAKQMERLAKVMDWPGITSSGNTGAAEQRRSIALLRQLASQAVGA